MTCNRYRGAFVRLALAALLASAAVACSQAPKATTCKPPEIIHLLVDELGQYLIPDDVALLRDGVDRNCKPAP